MKVMLGITGASGAPYAARVLAGLVAAGTDVGVVASAAAGQVIALELHGDRAMDGAGAVQRLVADHGGEHVRIWGERDWSAPYASGSARTDAVVICPRWTKSLKSMARGSSRS